jgi:UPF0042 nucleotide-binding protein
MNLKNKIRLASFGFKYGPPNANYYFDVSFIKNPARDKRWGFFHNVDDEMKNFILEQDCAQKFLENVEPLITFLASVDQGQVFAFGCNAGRHRSVTLVRELAKKLREKGVEVYVEHRDLERI